MSIISNESLDDDYENDMDEFESRSLSKMDKEVPIIKKIPA